MQRTAIILHLTSVHKSHLDKWHLHHQAAFAWYIDLPRGKDIRTSYFWTGTQEKIKISQIIYQLRNIQMKHVLE